MELAFGNEFGVLSLSMPVKGVHLGFRNLLFELMTQRTSPLNSMEVVTTYEQIM